jgi:hypothetical protein
MTTTVARPSYAASVAPVRRFLAAWGLDVLIVGTVVALSIALLALTARRRLPFVAPASMWIAWSIQKLDLRDRTQAIVLVHQTGLFPS